jgi:hypothetical protein
MKRILPRPPYRRKSSRHRFESLSDMIGRLEDHIIPHRFDVRLSLQARRCESFAGRDERECPMTPSHGLTHIRELLAGVAKEIVRRVELRERLEAEWGRHLTDEEFLAIAEAEGTKI